MMSSSPCQQGREGAENRSNPNAVKSEKQFQIFLKTRLFSQLLIEETTRPLPYGRGDNVFDKLPFEPYGRKYTKKITKPSSLRVPGIVVRNLQLAGLGRLNNPLFFRCHCGSFAHLSTNEQSIISMEWVRHTSS